MPIRVDDLLEYERLLYSRNFLDLFEAQITAETKRLLKKRRWAEEARRYLRYAVFLRYYATFESHLKTMCDSFADSEGLDLRISDINGENFLKRVNKYLTRVAHHPSIDRHRFWNDGLAYLWLRNTIIHSDGHVHPNTGIPQYVSQQFKQRGSGLTLSEGQIRFNRPFCYRAVGRMGALLFDVARQM